MALHDGHRERMKDRFIRDGLDNFEDYQVLEILLFYCIPRVDTNEIAHRLIERFGSLPNVLEASVDELQRVDGIGKHAAVFLSLINAACRYYQVKKVDYNIPLTSVDQYAQVLLPLFAGRRNETIYLLCLDAKCKMICCKFLGEGSVNCAGVSIRKIAEQALAVNATSVVLAHNHPSGVAVPSGEDVSTTLQAGKALKSVGVALLDHIVVADEDYISLFLSGCYRYEDIEI